MADDPMTVDAAEEITLREGLKVVFLTVSGPADYDATNGAALDVSSYVSSIKDISLNMVTAKADALLFARYVNDDITDSDGGAVFFTWDSSTAADAVFENVADTTDLSGYQFRVTLFGAP